MSFKSSLLITEAMPRQTSIQIQLLFHGLQRMIHHSIGYCCCLRALGQTRWKQTVLVQQTKLPDVMLQKLTTVSPAVFPVLMTVVLTTVSHSLSADTQTPQKSSKVLQHCPPPLRPPPQVCTLSHEPEQCIILMGHMTQHPIWDSCHEIRTGPNQPSR